MVVALIFTPDQPPQSERLGRQYASSVTKFSSYNYVFLSHQISCNYSVSIFDQTFLLLDLTFCAAVGASMLPLSRAGVQEIKHGCIFHIYIVKTELIRGKCTWSVYVIGIGNLE